ncbi:gliding motility-associated C-terminal domain-containing protein [Filimonas lacunae]|uniref:Gliding motility-associated C-terminal domain-containing protein n=1 Tax=Filimonas lacunae TaxID=477680 RepID=A0A1N7P7B3_9BACT|nr:discoidin domain-containing protein [Filimonas lacunae]SIT06427.1 gliding motility-associated C-terminal domain-containing protein [Filimonas lacunae]
MFRYLLTMLLVTVCTQPFAQTCATNLAYGKPAYTSSEHTAANLAIRAFDNNAGTRWESDWTDNQYIYVDLGADYSVCSVNLNWQSAPKSYRIDVSSDASNWTTLATVTNNSATSLSHTLNTTARYVRMYGLTRNNGYGFTMWEFQVMGTLPASATCYNTNVALNKTGTASSTYLQPIAGAFDGDATTRWASNGGVDPQWLYVDLGGEFDLCRVDFDWEDALAKNYTIDVSNDLVNWTTIKTITGNYTYDNKNYVSGVGRYIRMYGTARGTTFGYSIYEFRVYPVAPYVRIVNNANAAEPSTNGSFLVGLAPGLTYSQDVTVTYSVTGTATAGSDYTALTGTVVIPAGQNSVTVTVPVKDDNLAEGTETVIATITSAVATSGYNMHVNSPEKSATVTITDNESKLISISKVADASEDGTAGSFLISLASGVVASEAITVNYTISGTATNGVDYATLSGTAVIPANSSSVTVAVTPYADMLTEGTETVVATITGGASANVTYTPGTSNSATVNIADVVVKGYIYVHLRALNEESSPDFPFTLTGGPTTVAGFSLNDQPDYISALVDIGVSHGATTTGKGDGELWTALSTGAVYHRLATSSQWQLVSGVTGTALDGAGPGQFVFVNSTGNAYFYDNGTYTTIYTASSHSGVKAVDISYGGGRIAIACSNGSILKNNTTSGSGYTDAWTTLVASGSGAARLDILPSAGTVVYYNSSNSNAYTIAFGGGTATSLGAPGSTDVCFDDLGSIYSNGYKWSSGTTWVADATKGSSFKYITGGAGGQVWSLSNSTNTAKTIYTRTTSNGVWIDDERVRTSYKDNSIIIPVVAGTYNLGITNPTSWDLAGIDIYDPTTNSTANVPGKTASINVTEGEVVHVVMREQYLVPLSIAQNCGMSAVEDFGMAASAPSVITSYHYTSVITANDGYYTIQKVATGWNNASLVDHTTGSGNFMIVNASYQADEFYRKRLTNLVPGQQYLMSFWVANLMPQHPIQPNITAGVASTTGVDLSTINTGDITSTAWQQFTFTFTAQSATQDVYLRNNANGGSGNDLALDDIAINPLSGTIDDNVVSGGSNRLCMGGTYTLSNTSTGGKWKSSNPFIATIDSVTGVLSAVAVGLDTLTYTVSNTVGCVASKQTFIEVISSPVVTATPGSAAICLGSTVALNATVTSGKTPYTSYAWSAAPAANAGLAGTATQNTTATPAVADTYIYTQKVTDANGCVGSDTAVVLVNALPTATIAYGSGTYCASRFAADSALVTKTGNNAGTYTATPAGLVLNSGTGSISLKASTAGTYHITYSYTDNDTHCNGTASTDVVINALPTATISYSAASFCAKDTTVVTVTQSGVTSGSFSAPSGLVVNATRGTINLAASTPGTYRVLYTFTNSTTGCFDTTGATVTVKAMPTASIAYGANSYYTQGTAAVTITQSGVSSGSFSAGTGLVVDATTGMLNLAGSTAGTYRVLYTYTNGAGCSDTTGFTVIVKEIPAVSITKGADASEPSTNGSFIISLPSGKTFDQDITVTYTVSGRATNGTDYTTLSGTAVIPAGQNSVTVSVVVIDDKIIEGTETVVATISGASSSSVSSLPVNSAAASATVNIGDDESRNISITKTADASEDGTWGSFLVSLPTGLTAGSAVTVTYSIGGTATNGTDYSTLSGSVVIPAGSNNVTINVVPLPDALTEGTETVIATITAGAASSLTYTIGTSNSATVNIADVVPKGYVYVHLRALNEESCPDVALTLTGGPTTVTGFTLNDQPATISAMYDVGVGHGVTTDGTGDGELWASLSNGAIYKRLASGSTWVRVTGQTGTSIDGAGPGQCVYVNSTGNAYFYNNGTATQIFFPAAHSAVKAVDITYGNGRIAIACSDGSILVNNTTSGTTYTDSWTTLVASGAGVTRLDMLPSTGTILYLSGTTAYTIPFAGGTATSVGAPNGTDVAYDDYGNMYSSGYRRTGTTTWTADATRGSSFSKTTAGAGSQVWCISAASDTPNTLFTRTTSNGSWLDDERVRITYNDNSILIPVMAGTYTLGITNPASWDLGAIDIYDPTSNSTGNIPVNQASINVAAGEVVHVVMHEKLLMPLNISQTCSVSPVEDFGTGTTAPSVVTSYHYTSINKPNDGYYSIQKGSTGWTNNANLKDHTTGDGTGNYMIINASYQADEFYRKRITNLVVGLQYQMSFWVANLSPTNTIKPNITAGVASTDGVVLSSVSTGTFTNTAWVQYTFTFTAQGTTADVYLKNNANGGSGNDVALDDIAINPLSGTLANNTVSGGSTTLCLGSNYTFSNTAPGGVWTVYDASKAQINSGTGILNTLAVGIDTVIYTVSNAVGCVATKKTAVEIVSIPVVTATPGSGAICIGSTVALNAAATSGKTPYASYAWSASPAASAGIVNAAIQNTSAKPTVADTYVFTAAVKDANGCVGAGNATVVVNALPTATIAYGTGKYCYSRVVTDSAKVTVTGTAGGTFAALTTGLSMNAGTGSISLKNSTPGTYHIRYTFTNSTTGCGDTTGTNITINALPVAGISYSPLSYCRALNADSARVTRTGVAGGVYSAATGLALNATTGAVDVKSSTAGTYRVLYTFNDATTGCSDTTGAGIVIKALPVAHIAYSALNFCRKTDADSARITVTGTTGGVYSTVSGLSLNTVTGAVDVKSSTLGTYRVLYTFSDGSCSDTTSTYIIIKPLPVAQVSYSALSFCRKLDADSAKITQTGVAGGVYSSTTGLTLNTVSGSVDIKSSTAGTYRVLYTFSDGSCSDTTSTYIVIKPLPVAHIAYSSLNFCRTLNADSARVTATGTTGGVYSSVSGLSLNTVTGAVDVKSSTVGTYRVLYTFSDGSCSDTTSTYIVIKPLPVAHITYSALNFCRKLDADSAKVTQTGVAGGVYASAAGLTLNTASGSVDVRSSTAGTYQVLYTFSDGSCSDTTSTYIVIKPLPVAGFSYSALNFCRTLNADSAKITLTGTAGGTFTSTAGLTLNGVSGSVDVKSSTAGTYRVLYTFSDGSCSDTTSTYIIIKPLPVAHIAYSALNFCRTLNADSAKITQTGVAGGVYTSTAGLALNAASGAVDVKSSAVGTYRVLYTFSDGSCSDTTSTYIVIKPLPVAGFSYSALNFCRALSADSAKVTLTGTTGGTFTSDAGLSLNAASGSVDVKSSTAGTYRVLYTFSDGSCSDTTSSYIVIKPLPVAHITYSVLNFCHTLNADSAKITLTGTTGGTFTSAAGLALNAASGSVDVKSSTVGTYRVLYTFSDGSCSDTISTYIVIKPLPVAGIAYNTLNFCRTLNADSAKITQTGVAGGVYASAAGLSLNVVSGSVDVKSSTAGTYQVMYTFSDGSCSDTTSTYIVIKPLPVAGFSYSALNFCRTLNADSAKVTLTGTTGGTFTSAAGLTLNAASGSVDVKSSTAGTYRVLYTFSDGSCSDTTSTYIVIRLLPVASFSYSALDFCRKLDADSAKAILTGTTGGTFTSSAGLVLNAASGSVDVKNSAAGTYRVLYTFSDGNCSDTTSTYIVIQPLPVAGISYSGLNFCRELNADSAKITQTGVAGGVYTSASGLSLNAASGSVDVKSSAAGTYRVLYTFSDGSCSDTTSTYIVIKPLPVASISYSSLDFCRKLDADSAKITQTGVAGGVYTSTAGLSLNAASGSIDVKSSTAGTYQVLYSFSDGSCSDTTSTYIVIKPLPVAGISYSTLNFCRTLDADSAKLTQTGVTGGVYASAASLSLNAASGSVDVKSSTAGTYRVLYTFSDGSCSDTTSTYIVIKPLPVASISYSALDFCRKLDADSARITQVGVAGGVYSSATGLLLNAASGSVDVKSSTAGTYRVLYTFSDGSCSDTTSTYIVIKPLPVAGISYSALNFCRKLDADSAKITQTGVAGGIYTSTTGLSLNAASGAVDIKSSTAGTYGVLYTFSDGSCSDTTSTYIVIKPLPVASFSYSNLSYCHKLDADSAKVILTGATGGTFTSSTGLALNANSGSVDVKSSVAGTYQVLYTFNDANGGCSDTTSSYIIIKSLPVAHIAYTSAGYCGSKYADSARVTQTGTTGGTYASATGLSLHAVSGAVDVKSSTPGTYRVIYTFSDANTCGDTTSTYVTIYALPVVPAISGAADICKNSSTVFTNSMPGGVWSSRNPGIAAILASGTVNGVSEGTAIIDYAVTNTAGCTDSAQFTIRIAVAPVFTLSDTSLTCNGSNNGKIAVVTAETGLSYSLNAGTYQQSNVFSGLAAGTYTVTAKNAGGCTTAMQVTVKQPDVLSVSETHTNVVCHSESTGAVDVTVTGGTAPYTYSWTSGAVSQDISGLPAGTYKVTVKDANGCSSGVSATITEVIGVFTVNAPVKQKYGIVVITGTTVGKATVTVTYPDGTTSSAVAANNGNFSTTSPGDVNTGDIIVKVTDVATGAVCTKVIHYIKVPSADLEITKTLVTEGTIYMNAYATFQITVTNNGPDNATQVIVNDALASNIDRADSIVASKGTVTYNAVTGQLVWTIDAVNTDETVLLTFRVHVSGKGKLTNTATVTAKESDPDMSNNIASSTPATIVTQFLIPNVITPNGDGKNDTFYIGGSELYTGTDLIIFNRWGNEVYHSRNYDNSWAGIGLSGGVYYYVMKINMPQGQQVFKGYIQLLK